MKIAYDHLVQYIKEKPSLEDISNKLFQLGHEHEIDGNIFDMEFTPNRGDCLSLKGLLRDLAVFYNINFNTKVYTQKLDELEIDFKNFSKNICPQISFLKLEIDNIPKEYKHSLNSYFSNLGLNKNNFFTDVSNYLSYEIGQPTHCYDAKTISGELVFHEISEEHIFETLLEKKITLLDKNAVFSLNNDVINLAGVVGGKSTACSVSTKTVIVECAYFLPESIIGKSVKYDIQSEASHKFERGVDPNCQEDALRRFIQIVSDHTNIKNVSFVSYKSKDIPIYKIPLNTSKVNQIIGTNLNQEEYLNLLTKLGFLIDGDFIKVPSFRNDVKTQNDLSEEVARVIGYDNIKISEINIPKNTKVNNIEKENKLRYFLLDNGFYEVINSPFTNIASESSIKVDNPLDSNRKFLRTGIINSLLDNLLFNEKRQKDSIKLFEISDVYSSNNGLQKVRMLSIIASGRVGLNYEDFSKKISKTYLTNLFHEIYPNKTFDFYQIPRDGLDTKINNEIIGLEVDISIFTDDILAYNEIAGPPNEFIKYQPISEFPSSFKDISFSIKNYKKLDELEQLLINYQSDILKHVYIFDYFKNEKKEEIKIGFRFIFQSKKATITSSEIELVYNQLIDKSLKINGVKIPGL